MQITNMLVITSFMNIIIITQALYLLTAKLVV